MLSLRQVNNLYQILKPVLPENPQTLEILSYVGIVIDRIAISNPKAFIQACMILTDKNKREVMDMGGEKLHAIFLDGLKDNHFPEFQMFVQGLGL
jgi:hypothetical protein